MPFMMDDKDCEAITQEISILLLDKVCALHPEANAYERWMMAQEIVIDLLYACRKHARMVDAWS